MNIHLLLEGKSLNKLLPLELHFSVDFYVLVLFSLVCSEENFCLDSLVYISLDLDKLSEKKILSRTLKGFQLNDLLEPLQVLGRNPLELVLSRYLLEEL